MVSTSIDRSDGLYTFSNCTGFRVDVDIDVDINQIGNQSNKVFTNIMNLTMNIHVRVQGSDPTYKPRLVIVLAQ